MENKNFFRKIKKDNFFQEAQNPYRNYFFYFATHKLSFSVLFFSYRKKLSFLFYFLYLL